MSASLVGSEMCIRDSTSTDADTDVNTDTDTNKKTSTITTPTTNHDTHTPVSYTHLTLPTICSV
eukprot:14029078-Alexandrium_andersonii.AAC.1